jgi:hypothetical protein
MPQQQTLQAAAGLVILPLDEHDVLGSSSTCFHLGRRSERLPPVREGIFIFHFPCARWQVDAPNNLNNATAALQPWCDAE